jgi:amino acid transporter
MTDHDDDRAIIEAGYQPQLRRGLSYLSSFAISFSLMSITTGIFANYGFVLTKAGPFGYWTWFLVGIGHMLVALVFAEMAARIPLAGYAYNWNTKLANPTVGWFTGWIAFSFYSIGVAAVSTTAVPVLGVILGRDIAPLMGCYITTGLILAQLVISLQGIRLTSHVTTVAVIAELVGMIGLALFVLYAVLTKGHPNLSLLTTIPAEPRPYWQAFLMASLLGAWTFVGFECSADMSEETVNVKRVAPFGIIASIAVSIVVGFFFIFIMTIAIPDLPSISGATYPLAAIASYYLGDTMTKIFLVFVLVAIFSCSLGNLNITSRLLFAMSRDNRFVAPKFFRKISSHKVPARGMVLVAAIGIFFTFMTDSAISLYGASSILAALCYLITVLSFAFGGTEGRARDSFTLGRWHWPVVVLAAAWLIVEMGILTIPAEFHSAAIATGGVLAVGFLLFPFVGRKGSHK